MWTSRKRQLTEASEDWGVLLVTNITQSNVYTCAAGLTRSTKVYSIKAIGESEAFDLSYVFDLIIVFVLLIHS